jgi:hypothetical protein
MFRTRSSSILCLVLLAVLRPNLAGQEIPKLLLKVKETLPAPAGLVRSIATIPPRCDGEGNLYFRPVREAPANPMSAPYIRVSADGRHIVSIGLESVPDFPKDDSHIETVALGLRGGMYLLAWKDDGYYFLDFDDEGKFRSASKVDRGLLVSHLAVFPTGEILAAGEKVPEKSDDPTGVPFTAILDRNGKLLKELALAGDVKPEPGKAPDQQSMAIDLGAAVPGDDGNIYLLRAAEKPLIFVISPAGEVVRKLILTPPGDNYHGSNFSVAAGKIVMEFFKPNNDQKHSGTFLYSLYDAETGERQIDYVQPPDTYGIFACYTPNQFTFLGVEGDGLSIVHAVPR